MDVPSDASSSQQRKRDLKPLHALTSELALGLNQAYRRPGTTPIQNATALRDVLRPLLVETLLHPSHQSSLRAHSALLQCKQLSEADPFRTPLRVYLHALAAGRTARPSTTRALMAAFDIPKSPASHKYQELKHQRALPLLESFNPTVSSPFAWYVVANSKKSHFHPTPPYTAVATFHLTVMSALSMLIVAPYMVQAGVLSPRPKGTKAAFLLPSAAAYHLFYSQKSPHYGDLVLPASITYSGFNFANLKSNCQVLSHSEPFKGLGVDTEQVNSAVTLWHEQTAYPMDLSPSLQQCYNALSSIRGH